MMSNAHIEHVIPIYSNYHQETESTILPKRVCVINLQHSQSQVWLGAPESTHNIPQQDHGRVPKAAI